MIVKLCTICSLCATSHPHSPVGPYCTASAEFTTFSVKRGAFELVVRFSPDQLADILNDEDTSTEALAVPGPGKVVVSRGYCLRELVAALSHVLPVQVANLATLKPLLSEVV